MTKANKVDLVNLKVSESQNLNLGDFNIVHLNPGPIAERSNLLDHGRGDPSLNP